MPPTPSTPNSTTTVPQFEWYLPTTFGDVKLTRVTDGATLLTLAGLTPTERVAVQALLERAVRPGLLKKQPWCTDSQAREVDLGKLGEQTLTLKAPISEVQKFLQKKLKPHRKQVSAVRFSNGKIEELTEATLTMIDGGSSAELPVTLDERAPPAAKRKPVVAVTVAQPEVGCPAPDFDDANVRANRVLRTFLDPIQIKDFNERQQFLAVGADTGHRYLITSRASSWALRLGRGRSLFDIDDDEALCVHDWEVPPAEEMLGLYLHLRIPGLESYVRSVPDRDGVLG